MKFIKIIFYGISIAHTQMLLGDLFPRFIRSRKCILRRLWIHMRHRNDKEIEK